MSTQQLIQQGIDAGLHTGAQLYATIDRAPVMELAIGEATPGVAMSPDTVNLWLSMTKPTVAVLIAQRIEAGEVALDTPVAEVIPEFAAHGKDGVTLEHVLTHTGGFRAARFKFATDDWDTIIAAICDAPPEKGWAPGEKAGYHVHTGWFILGEIVQRLTDRSLPEVIRADLFEPLGMDDCWVGMTSEAYQRYTGQDRLGVMMDTTQQPPTPADGFADRRFVTGCRPSGNGFGPMRQLARFYEMLLGRGERDGVRVLRPQTVEMFTRRRRIDMYDKTFIHTVDWGLGFIVNSARHGVRTVPYGYGLHASRETFGHGGSQSSSSFADPEHGLAVALYFNGMPGEKAHQKRLRPVLTALYEDIGLAEPA